MRLFNGASASRNLKGCIAFYIILMARLTNLFNYLTHNLPINIFGKPPALRTSYAPMQKIIFGIRQFLYQTLRNVLNICRWRALEIIANFAVFPSTRLRIRKKAFPCEVEADIKPIRLVGLVQSSFFSAHCALLFTHSLLFGIIQLLILKVFTPMSVESLGGVVFNGF